MIKVTPLALLNAAMAFSLGCMVDMPLPPDSDRFDAPGFDEPIQNFDGPEEPTTNFVLGDMELLNGEMEGEIGAVRGFGNHGVIGLEGWSENTYSSVFTTALGDNGAGMSIVEVNGGFFHPDLAPGTTNTYDSTDYPLAGEAFVYVIGCSGDEVGDWSFDREADQTTISVSENPDDSDVINVRYSARFSNWDNTERSVVGGTFEMRQR